MEPAALFLVLLAVLIFGSLSAWLLRKDNLRAQEDERARREQDRKISAEQKKAIDAEASKKWLQEHNSSQRETISTTPRIPVWEQLAKKVEEEQGRGDMGNHSPWTPRPPKPLVGLAATNAWRVEEYRKAQARYERELEAIAWRSLSKSEQIELWLEKRTSPAPQPFGVSDRGAEILAGAWLEYLGEESVEVTQATGDGGVDVATEHFCCQVKNYAKQPVGASEVRDLFGTATSLGLKPLIFTSSSLSREAELFSEANSIYAINYDAVHGSLSPLNDLGRELLVSGRYSQ